jgi:hypothetical protein
MNINVDVTDITLDSPVGDRNVYSDEYGEVAGEQITLGEIVAHQIAKELLKDEAYDTLKSKVLKIRSEEIREQLKPIIVDAINGPIQRTNSFGDPIGAETSLRAMIVAEAKSMLTANSSREFGGREKGSLLQQTLRGEIAAALKAELSAVLQEEKEKMTIAFRGHASEILTEAMRKVVR